MTRTTWMWTVAVAAACGCSAPDDAPTTPDGGGGPEPGVAMNDVSILFPMPANDGERARSSWLAPRAGETGPYFPFDLEDQLPSPNADVPIGYGAAMVTALRYDPCFPRSGGEACEAQLRLVAQPVLTSATGVDMLEDAAAHLFYRLDATASAAVRDALLAARALSPVPTSGVLRVHPGLAHPDGEALATALRELIVAHCREDNLIRITTNHFAFDNWGFGKFDVVGGQLVRQPIAGMVEPGESQSWIRQAVAFDLEDPTGTITPAPAEDFAYLLARANFADGAPRDASAARAAVRVTTRLDDPQAITTEEADCASCHLATQARLFAARQGVTVAPSFTPPAGYDTTLVLAPELDGNLGATIAFGWHRQRDGRLLPSLSQRVVNESAEVAAALARDLAR